MRFRRTERSRIEQVVNKDYDERVYHKPPRGIHAVTLGLIVALLIGAGVYLAVAKSLPFTGPSYEATAVFENATTLRKSSPVRIAGVKVGEVTSVQPDGELARVTFSVDDAGLPLHDDAEITIRPRLFLEGNFFLDVRPGSPEAPELPDGGTVPVTRTATAVQLDQILTALQQPDRQNLSDVLRGYGSALNDSPTPAEDVGQDPDVQGLSAAESLNVAFQYGGRAGRGTSIVSQALLGSDPQDLSGLIDASGKVFGALGRNESELRGLISNFAITAKALADESTNLGATIRELAPTLEQARPSLVRLNRTFPPLRSFANALRPGIRELPATIAAGNPWLIQARGLLQPSELGGLAKDLGAATPPLAAANRALTPLLGQLQQTSRCASGVLAPTGDIIINDDFATGDTNFDEFFYGLASQAGEGANFDGNGPFLRILAGGDAFRSSAPNPGGGFQDGTLFADSFAPPLGSQPLKPASNPPVRLDVPCAGNDLPDVNGPRGQVGQPTPQDTGVAP